FLSEALKSTEKLARDDPKSTTFQFASTSVRVRLAQLYGDEGDSQAVLDACSRARQGLQRGLFFGARHAYFGPMLRPLAVQQALTLVELGRFDEALVDWDAVLADDAGKHRLRLAALVKRFDWKQVMTDGTGRYRHLWEASRALTQARRAG